MARVGFPCPHCGATRSGVVDSRRGINYTRRRRECPECGHRWTTVEVIAEPDSAHSTAGQRIIMLRGDQVRTLEAARDLLESLTQGDSPFIADEGV